MAIIPQTRITAVAQHHSGSEFNTKILKIRGFSVNNRKISTVILVSKLRCLFGGGGWIRTTVGIASRFTVCPLWPLGNTPICALPIREKMELVDGFEPPTCWLQISCSTGWAIPATQTARLIIDEECQKVKRFFWKKRKLFFRMRTSDCRTGDLCYTE